MIIGGVDTSKLPAQFERRVPGRTLILDGDGLCYRVSATVKRIDTAIRKYQQEVLTLMFLTQSQYATVHLTAKDSWKNGRFEVQATKPYQGQRKGKAKPPLLEPLREAVAMRENWLDEYNVILHRELEADDGIIIQAHQLGESGIVYSEDKDMRMTPYPYWEIERGVLLPSTGYGNIWEKYTPAGTLKVLGHGRKFFWAQMLMGDSADHIQGIQRYYGKLCGPSMALSVLESVQCEHECANVVLDAYREADQNPHPEAHLLWLLRTRTDKVQDYFDVLALSEHNRRFLNECNSRDWFTPAGNSWNMR